MTEWRTRAVWRKQPMDNHFWAFYYLCKRMGDKLRLVKHGDGTADLHVWRKAK